MNNITNIRLIHDVLSSSPSQPTHLTSVDVVPAPVSECAPLAGGADRVGRADALTGHGVTQMSRLTARLTLCAQTHIQTYKQRAGRLSVARSRSQEPPGGRGEGRRSQGRRPRRGHDFIYSYGATRQVETKLMMPSLGQRIGRVADIDQWQMEGSCGRRLYIGTRDAVGREGTGRAISNRKGGGRRPRADHVTLPVTSRDRDCLCDHELWGLSMTHCLL